MFQTLTTVRVVSTSVRSVRELQQIARLVGPTVGRLLVVCVVMGTMMTGSMKVVSFVTILVRLVSMGLLVVLVMLPVRGNYRVWILSVLVPSGTSIMVCFFVRLVM